MTTLAIDIGNSNIVLGLYKDSKWEQLFRYPSDTIQPPTFYSHGLQEVLLEWQVHPTDIQQVVMSSVVPDLTRLLEQELQRLFGHRVQVLGPELYSQLPFHIPKPYEIGSDIVANALAVHHLHDGNWIIVDFGTALTFTVFDKSTGIEGVTIAPGLKTAMSALAGNTAQLPEADIDLPSSIIGKNTEHAIQAGVLHGYVGLVSHLVSSIKKELASSYRVIATGGMATQLPLEHVIDFTNKQLTLEGIRLASDFT